MKVGVIGVGHVGGDAALSVTRRGVEGKFLKKAVEEYVKPGNINIIRGKGASEFAIGTVIARVVEAIVRDERIVIPCSCYSEEYGVTLSLLHRVGRRGVLDEFEIEGNQEEQEGIQRSVGALKAAMERLNRNSVDDSIQLLDNSLELKKTVLLDRRTT